MSEAMAIDLLGAVVIFEGVVIVALSLALAGGAFMVRDMLRMCGLQAKPPVVDFNDVGAAVRPTDNVVLAGGVGGHGSTVSAWPTPLDATIRIPVPDDLKKFFKHDTIVGPVVRRNEAHELGDMA